ncbi:uncharacterized protein B0J16DRAFT_343713 [Fusarium flagelliforme]|uniref:uncharacterized protein n=1 Tax=Fusarium flagelliforme TaxID=2675880 RepID=UPI001E8D6DE2|nr:uncharacterized protein B0J16DRAFT_343713 [Fusarium flagelliforme]KAH7182451.1 hypothetical protein B0J16DRAFT_343713 [Fusarium flagelliforme]
MELTSLIVCPRMFILTSIVVGPSQSPVCCPSISNNCCYDSRAEDQVTPASESKHHQPQKQQQIAQKQLASGSIA